MEKFLKNQQIPLTQVIDPNTGQAYYAPQNVVYQDKNNTGATYLKDVIVDQAITASYFSGSVLNAVSASYALTASYVLGLSTSSISSSYALSASYAANGGVTQLLAGPNITLSPTTGVGQVTISSTGGGGGTGNTATGSYGSFYSTQTQTNVAGTARSMSLNTTDITNGVSISGSTNPFNTYIKVANAGVYDIQFSAQVDKTDSGTDEIWIWIRKNGTNISDSATSVQLVGNGAHYVAAWNFFVNAAANDYFQLMWYSPDANVRLHAESAFGVVPGIPSLIVTANRVDQFLSNTGSFSGSFIGAFTGSFSGSGNITSASYAATASYVNPLNQTVIVTGSLIVSGSSTFTNIGPAIFSGSITQTASTASFGGLVGIGTTTPSQSLDVNGTARIVSRVGIGSSPLSNRQLYVVGSSTFEGQLDIRATSANARIQFTPSSNDLFIRSNDGSVQAISIFQGGNIAMGSETNAGSKLLVRGSGTTSATTSLLVQNANASASLSVTDDSTFYFKGASNTSLRIKSAIEANSSVIQFNNDGLGGGYSGGYTFTNGGNGSYGSGVSLRIYPGKVAIGNVTEGTLQNNATNLYVDNTQTGGRNKAIKLNVNFANISTEYNGINFDTIENGAGGAFVGSQHNPLTNGYDGDLAIFCTGGNNSSYTEIARFVGKSKSLSLGAGKNPSASLHISGSSGSALLKIDSPLINNILFVSGSGNVGIGTGTPVTTLDISGSGRFTNNLTITGSFTVVTGSSIEFQVNQTGVKIGNAPNDAHSVTGSFSISSSAGTGSAIYAYKSGSTVLDIQGSQGQLFSVIDALSGSLMSVNDVSGLPILEVFSDDRVVMGTYGAPALTVTGSTLRATGSLLGTASYATTALSASYAPSSPTFPYTGDAIITGSILARGLGSTNATTTLNIVNASGNNIIRGYDDGGIRLGNAVNQNQYINIGTAGNSIDFYTLNAHRFYVIDGTYSPAIAMYIKGAAGDPMVGIKTTNPSFNLDVSGSGNFTNSLTVTGSLNLNGSDISSAWIPYTPTWTAASTNPVIGNGTITGQYKVIGKICFVRGNIAMGSTTTFGSGEWYVSMPFTASHADAILMTANLLDNGTAWYNATINGARAGFNYKTAIQYQAVGGTANDINATQPFTWANSDRFLWNGSFEIA
jgi:hypothetical protein